ncbi:DUF6397 family protein [Streptomyces olivaceus]|uniref:DUF6397 family protein n=1 Tax=Streptomyces olivaceus TaxID=47716 RepID=UPI00069363DD|nr:DUF6397 family protein [Streptomyces olivaceus]MBZ6102849.1 hypothetical protein [Streptomyces olivaceus]MBZ6283899.1 hypothetical protein [Streptomyces olivaceus]
MTGSTAMQEETSSAVPTGTDRHTFYASSRAARELGLRRSEFDLAVHLGRIRTVPDDERGGRRVTHDEVERIRAGAGFPRELRDAVRAVGTTEGAELMKVTKTRFTRLARLGLVVPVRFYVNRYRTVVWLYLADELRQFAADERNTALLRGRTPEGLRGQLDEGLDLRARNWRGRDLGCLLRQADGPWARAAAVASLLDAAEVSDVVTDPYDRSRLRAFRPVRQLSGSPGSPAAQLAEEIMTAADPDEIDWLRADLANEVEAARRQSPVPCTVSRAAPARRGFAPEPQDARNGCDGPGHQRPRPRHEAAATGRFRDLLGRLRRAGT